MRTFRYCGAAHGGTYTAHSVSLAAAEAQYRSPIKDLWMCGASTHPGGGVMGAPGRNVAMEILRESRGNRTMTEAYAVL